MQYFPIMTCNTHASVVFSNVHILNKKLKLIYKLGRQGALVLAEMNSVTRGR